MEVWKVSKKISSRRGFRIVVFQYFRRTCMEMQSIRFRGMSCAVIFRTRLAANSTLDIGRSCMLSHDVTPPGNSISKYQQKLVLEHSDDTPWKINMEPNNFPPPWKGGFHQPKLTNYQFWASKSTFSTPKRDRGITPLAPHFGSDRQGDDTELTALYTSVEVCTYGRIIQKRSKLSWLAYTLGLEHWILKRLQDQCEF